MARGWKLRPPTTTRRPRGQGQICTGVMSSGSDLTPLSWWCPRSLRRRCRDLKNACSCRFLQISAETRRSQALEAQAPPRGRRPAPTRPEVSRVLPTNDAHREEGRMRNSASADRRDGDGQRTPSAQRHGNRLRGSGATRRGHGRSPRAGHHQRVLVGVQTLRFAPPPRRGADGLDADSALAPGAASRDRPVSTPTRRVRRVVRCRGVEGRWRTRRE
jgi:hypothetical protein